MEKSFPRIHNFNVSVKEVDGKVIFLRKLEPRGSEHSFGIHVAEIAGMPRSIVKRANTVLKELEADNANVGSAVKKPDMEKRGAEPRGRAAELLPARRPRIVAGSRRDSKPRHQQSYACRGSEQAQRD